MKISFVPAEDSDDFNETHFCIQTVVMLLF